MCTLCIYFRFTFCTEEEEKGRQQQQERRWFISIDLSYSIDLRLELHAWLISFFINLDEGRCTKYLLNTINDRLFFFVINFRSV